MIAQLKTTLPRLLIAALCVIAITARRSSADDAATTAPSDSAVTPDFSGSTLTLHLTDEPIDALLTEIQRLSGNPTSLENPANTNSPTPAPLDVNVDGQPFWKVIADICDERNLGVGVMADGGLQLASPQYSSLTPGAARDTSGPALLVAQSIEHQDDLTADGKGADYCVIRITGLIEPRFKALYYENVAAPSAAVDDNGLSLLPGGDVPLDDPGSQADPKSDDYHIQMLANRYPFGFSSQAQILHYALRIYVPPNAGRRIAHVAGTFRFWNAARTGVVKMEAADFNGTVRSFGLEGGLTLFVDRGMSGPRMTSVSVTLKHAGRTDAQWSQDVRFFGFAEVSMVDQAGKSADMASNSQSWSSFQHTWFFPIGDVPLKEFAVAIPTAVREIDMPFAFSDLPLP